METPGERLTAAREAAGFKSGRQAALRYGWPVSTYKSHENGQTPEIPHDAAVKYAKAFKVSAAWLMTGEGEMKPGRRSKFVELFEALPLDKQPQVIDYMEFLKHRR